MSSHYAMLLHSISKFIYGIPNREWTILQFFAPKISERGKDYCKPHSSVQRQLIQNINKKVFPQF